MPSQWILSHCPHVKGSQTPVTPMVRKEVGGMQTTHAPLTGSLAPVRRKGKPGRVKHMNCRRNTPSGRKGVMRLRHPNQNGTWVATREKRSCGDRTHSHRSIGRTHPGRISTPGTTLSPKGSPTGDRSKATVRDALKSDGGQPKGNGKSEPGRQGSWAMARLTLSYPERYPPRKGADVGQGLHQSERRKQENEGVR